MLVAELLLGSGETPAVGRGAAGFLRTPEPGHTTPDGARVNAVSQVLMDLFTTPTLLRYQSCLGEKLMKALHKFPVTFFATALAAMLTLLSLFTHFDLFTFMLEVCSRIKSYHMDKLAMPVAVILAGWFIDHTIVRPREEQEAEIQAQRLRVLKATMRSVHHIVNN